MNDLKQEYLDKKYTYVDDESCNVKAKNSKKRPKKANHKHQYHCAVVVDGQQNKYYIGYCNVCGKVIDFCEGKEYNELPKEFSHAWGGAVGIYGLRSQQQLQAFEEYTESNFPVFYVENFCFWKTKYMSIEENNE